MTDYEVLFDGTPGRPLGRQLFAEEHAPRTGYVRPHLNSRPANDTTGINMGRRKNPSCSMCSRRVDAPGDDLCRVCRR